MTKWLADLFIGIGEALLTEQARAERGGITINATEVHIHTEAGQSDSLDKSEVKAPRFPRFKR